MIIVFHKIFPSLAGLMAGSLILHELFSEGFYNAIEDVAWRLFQMLGQEMDASVGFVEQRQEMNAMARKRTL